MKAHRLRPDPIKADPEVREADLDAGERAEVTAEEVKSDFVLTTIGKEIFETLDHALAIGKMVVIDGAKGFRAYSEASRNRDSDCQ